MTKPMRLLFAVLCLCPLIGWAQTREIFNVGNNPNDGSGDSLRSAFIKAGINDSNLFAAVFTNNAPIRVVESLGELQTITTASAGTVFVAGGDGGFFRWSASDSFATNAVDRIANPYGAGSGRYIRQPAMGGTISGASSTEGLTFTSWPWISLSASEDISIQPFGRLTLYTTNLPLIPDPADYVLSLTDASTFEAQWRPLESIASATLGTGKLTKIGTSKKLETVDLPVADIGTAVDNVAALVVLNPTDRTVVQTLGYYSPGDGGAATYRWASGYTAATNAYGGALAVSGGAWVQVHSGEVNVRQFGARGDGATDDTERIGAAVSFGRTIRIPEGQYLISTNISIPNSGTSIVGDAGSLLSVYQTNLFGSVFYAHEKTGVDIEGITASAPSHVPVYLLRADLTSRVTVQNNTVTNMGLILTRGYINPVIPGSYTSIVDQINTYDISKQSDIKVVNNTAIGSWQPDDPLFLNAGRVDYAQDVIFSGNRVENYGFGLWGIGGARLFVDVDGIGHLEGGAGRTLASTPLVNRRITYTGNVATNVQAAYWYAFCDGITFTGNVVDGCNDVGLDVELAANAVITGNVMRNCKNGGVYIGDVCRNVTVSGNTFHSDDAGMVSWSPGTLLRVDANGLSTNIVIVGNTFNNGTTTNLSDVRLAFQSAGIEGLVYSDNLHYNAPTIVDNGRSKDLLFTGNMWIQTMAPAPDSGGLVINWGPESNVDVHGNTFLWRPGRRVVATVATNAEITLVPELEQNTPLTTGEAVTYLANSGSVKNLQDGSIYYVSVVSTNVVKLYDSQANAIESGATGLLSTTNLSFGIVAPALVKYKDAQYAIRLMRDLGGRSGSVVSVSVRDNTIDWPSAIWAGASPDTWSANQTNFTGYANRQLGPLLVNMVGNKFGQQVKQHVLFRHDMLGWNAALSHGENIGYDGRRVFDYPPTNVFVLRQSRWFDANFAFTANSGFTANRNGFWQNSLGQTSWVSNTVYNIGDLALSDGRVYACVFPGTSTEAPTGVGDVAGVIRDGTLTWVNCGSFYLPLTPFSTGQLGVRRNAGSPRSSVTPNFSGEELYDISNFMWWKASNTTQDGWLPLGNMNAVETLNYSDVVGPAVVVLGRKGGNQKSFLAATNDFTLRFTSYMTGDSGTIYVHPATTNITAHLASDVYSPSGPLTITGGTGGTNYTVIAWNVEQVGGTNRVSANAANYHQ